MSERILTAAELNRAMLARQLLLERTRLGPVQAIEQLVALQAQEPASPHLALWTRLEDFDVADLHAALHDRAVVKGTLLRVTLHLVSAADYAQFWPALEPSFHQWRAPIFRQVGLGPEVEALGRQAAAFAAEPRLGAEISAHLPPLTGGPGPAGQSDSWWAIRPVLPFLMAPGDERWSFGRRPRFVSAPAWLEGPLGAYETGLRHLVRRYLRGFGPAGVDDIHQMTRVRTSEIRAALDSLETELVTYRDERGRLLFDLPGAPIPDRGTSAPVRFLPMWDSVLLAYQDRARIIPEAYRRVVIRTNGDFLPTFMVDGLVAGLWRADLVDGHSKVTPLPFEPLTAGASAEVADEAARLERFLDPREAAVYARYATTWLKDSSTGGPSLNGARIASKATQPDR
jgi:hypothetical protein